MFSAGAVLLHKCGLNATRKIVYWQFCEKEGSAWSFRHIFFWYGIHILTRSATEKRATCTKVSLLHSNRRYHNYMAHSFSSWATRTSHNPPDRFEWCLLLWQHWLSNTGFSGTMAHNCIETNFNKVNKLRLITGESCTRCLHYLQLPYELP